MNWLEPVDLYCERTGPGLGAEPLNAVTNFAFIIMALVLWAQFARTRPVQSQARVLAALMAIVGLGSGSLHTFAVRLTALLDILGILIFIMYFIALYVRQVLRQNMWVNLLISIA